MFPLKERIISGYTFGVPTSYSSFHLGCDYRARNVALYAPFDGNILLLQNGVQGGWTIWFRPDHDQNTIMRFMHLDGSMKIPVGHVTEGQQIAITDTSGWATGPHLHLDCHEGLWISSADITNHTGWIDPETYDWNWKKPEAILASATSVPVTIADFWVTATFKGQCS